MLYASFGVLVQCFYTWVIYSYMWGIVFVIRMLIKDYSLSKKQGWKEYSERSWMLIPKLGGKPQIAIPIYATFILSVSLIYMNGGIEESVNFLRSKF